MLRIEKEVALCRQQRKKRAIASILDIMAVIRRSGRYKGVCARSECGKKGNSLDLDEKRGEVGIGAGARWGW